MLVAALIGALFTGIAATAATATTMVARGSDRQVYATGLKAGAGVELLNSKGKVVAKRKVNFLGGALFRNVRPGTGYRVKQLPSGPRSGALTVHDNNPAQW